MELNKDRRDESIFWDLTFPQAEFDKFNKKYKAIVDKKRWEKLCEEKDMMMVYLRRGRILIERVPTKQLYPDWNSRTNSFEKGGTDVGDQDDQDWIQSICWQLKRVVDS